MKKIITILLMGTLGSLFIGIGIFLSDWLFILFFIALLFIATNLIWGLFSLNIRKFFKDNRRRFVRIALICLIFFFFGGAAINQYCLPEMFHPISLLGNAGILLFTIFLGWGLIKLRKKKVLCIVTAVFILFICSLRIVSSATRPYIKPSAIAVLKSLPYATWIPAEKNIEKIGVTINKDALSYKGLNVYCPAHTAEAHLIDMLGETMHTWSDSASRWQHIEMCGNGDLLGLTFMNNLVRLDWDSNIMWRKKMRFHHDFAIAENKDIYALAAKRGVFFYSGLPLFIRNEYIVVLSPGGKIKKRLPLFKILKKEIPPNALVEYRRWISSPKKILEIIPHKLICLSGKYYHDIFHANTIEIIDKDIEGLCKKGDLLICVRDIDLVGILDIKKEKLIWKWGQGTLDMPHHPTLLENGNILIFDNGLNRGYSRIIELNPLTKKIVWEYKASPPERFFSGLRGANQRLPNGNTLITESDKGHVFEITRGGEIVWEFYSTDIKKADKKRAAIYRMMRITDPENYPFLKRLK